MQRAVVVILDGLRRDFVDAARTPRLAEFAGQAESFPAYRTAFPSATRVVTATFATGCHPARHTLQGNSMALLEDGVLVPHDAGAPDFLQHKRAVSRPCAGGAHAGRTPGAAWRSDRIQQRLAGCGLRARPGRPRPCLSSRRLIRPRTRRCRSTECHAGCGRRSGHDRTLHRRCTRRTPSGACRAVAGRAGPYPAQRAARLAGTSRGAARGGPQRRHGDRCGRDRRAGRRRRPADRRFRSWARNGLRRGRYRGRADRRRAEIR